MSDRLEDIIRQWARTTDEPPPSPRRRGDSCLTFAQAERIARGEHPPRAELGAHIETCDYCRKLVADFGEAIARPTVSVRNARPRAFAKVYWAVRVLAASVLLAVGGGILFIALRPTKPTDGALVSADVVGASGLRPKGPITFASGDQVTFGIRLRRQSTVMLLNVDPGCLLWPWEPKPTRSGELAVRLPAGRHALGPHTLGDTVGWETFLIVAFEQEIEDLPAEMRKLQTAHEKRRDIDALVRSIRSWPAEVKIISFQHVKR